MTRKAGASTPHRSNTHSPFSGSAQGPTGDDHQEEWARQEQQVSPSLKFYDVMVTVARQMMIQQQDQTINSIAGTLSTIAQQAGLMGSEISEHNECAVSAFIPTRVLICCRMLDDLDHDVDRTDSKLSDAMRRMRKLVREIEGQSPPLSRSAV